MSVPIGITAHFGGRPIHRAEVLAWEVRRATAVARKLGVADSSNEVARLRNAILDRKRELGHAAIERLLATELRVSEWAGRIGAAVSSGRRRLCTIELTTDGGSTEILPRWYERAITTGDEAPLLAACPDHYISRIAVDGLQEVFETTGGAPTAVRMFFDSRDLSTLTTKPDPSFRVEWAGVARTAGGTAIGGIRHLFHDSPSGSRAQLTVEFPLTTPGFMVRAHQWHLACEFSNWIEMANADS